MIEMFRRLSLPVQILLGLLLLTLIACGGSGSSDPEPTEDDVQRSSLSQSGSGNVNINVLIGGTIDLVVSYDPNLGTNGTLEGTAADTINFEYDSTYFEDIAPITIPNPGQSYSTTITVNVRVNSPVAMTTIDTNLTAGGTSVASQENTSVTVNINSADPNAVTRMTMTPADVSNTGTGMGELVITPTPSSDQTWTLETDGVDVMPSADQVVTAGNTGFTFDANSTGMANGFAAFSWRRMSDNYQVYYEYFFHPDTVLFYGSDTWTGTLSDGGAGTADLTLSPMRAVTAGQGGWASNVSVGVNLTIGAGSPVNWTEQLTYPFQLSTGNTEYRVTFTANGTDIDVTVEVRTNGSLTATYTGTLMGS